MLRDRRSSLAAALVAVAAILWGLWPSALRWAGLPPLQTILVIQLVQASPAVWMGWRERAAFRDRGAVAALVLFGLFDAIQGALYFPALTRGPVAVAALTHYLGPVLVALAAPFIPGERGSRRALVAAPLSLYGLHLVMGPWDHAPVATALLGAGSAVFGAGTLFTIRRAGRSFTPLAVCSLHAVVSAACVLAFYGPAAVPAPGAGVAMVAGAALVLGIGASILFNRAVRGVSAPIASTITYVEPITAVGMGWLLAGERLGGWAGAGAALVIAAGVWVALEPAPPAAAPELPARRAA